MTSYELLDFYEEVLKEIKKLDSYNNRLLKLATDVNFAQNNLLKIVYSDLFSTLDNQTLNKARDHKNNVIEIVQDFAINFDVLENHEKLINTKDSIKNILKKHALESEKDKIEKLLDKYDNITKLIYNYVKNRKNSTITDILNEVTFIVNEYTSLSDVYETISYSLTLTENKIEEDEKEKLLSLYFYDEQSTPKYFTNNIGAINESYEIICQMLKISSIQYPLKVVKIESGSLLEKFIGYESVVDALAFIIKKVTELIFNKFTYEGQVLRHKQILDLLKEDAEVIEKYKELGIDIREEDVIKYHYQLVKSIGVLVGQTTKLKINDTQMSLSKNLEEKYLIESNKLIEEINIKED